MDMNRKQFLGTMLAGVTAGCIPAFACPEKGTSEFEKCRNDILYFVDNYLVVDDDFYGKLKMIKQQREYLKRISTTPDYFFCAKGRQIGISTANVVFAYWKTIFFGPDHLVFVVEPNREMCRRMEEKYSTVSNTGAFMPLPHKVVFITPSTMMANDLFDKNSTFILDEFAFYDYSSIDSLSLSHLNDFLARLIDAAEYQGVSLSPAKFIVVSTPSSGDDQFSMFMHYVNNKKKLVLPSPTRGLKA